MFTYQGNLEQHGHAYSGNVDMEFRLFDRESGGEQIGTTISQTAPVSNGLFQVDLDFGNAVYETAPVSGWWLEVTIAGVDLNPRQPITAAPIALRGAVDRFASGTGKATRAGSTAMGIGTTASGFRSTAMGRNTTASGEDSIAMGFASVASNDRSTAMGWNTNASGGTSTAMGGGTLADGYISTAMGAFARADGDYSTAMGYGTRAHGNFATTMGLGTMALAQGMVAMGNYNAPTGVSGSIAPDRPALVVGNGSSEDDRSYAMYLLFNGNMRIAGSLTQNSDRNVKHDIVPIDPLDVLQNVSRLDISSWRYNHSPDILHIGPMAQDFHAVFGVGEDDTSISTLDTGGISLAAVQGVHELVQHQRERIAALEAKIDAQNVQLSELKQELAAGREAAETRLSALEEILSQTVLGK